MRRGRPLRFADDGRFGVTVLGRAHHDAVVADIAGLLLGEPPGPVPSAAHPPGIPLVVLGAHLTGLACDRELTDAGARLICPVRTAPAYRLHCLDGIPARPALVRVRAGGVSIVGELWSMPPAGLAALATRIPAPLSLGRVELADGTTELGLLGEAAGCRDAPGISSHRGWRAYLAASGAS